MPPPNKPDRKGKARWHGQRIDAALSDLEAGEVGNEEHYRAIKALAGAVRWMLGELEQMPET